MNQPTFEFLWRNNEIQFARLICEMEELDMFHPDKIAALCEAMDLGRTDVEELLDRAQQVFDTAKANLPKD